MPKEIESDSDNRSATGGVDHEGDGDDGDGDAGDDAGGERFAEGDGTHEDGGDGLEHFKDGGLGGSDIPGGHCQSSGGYDGGQHGKPYQAEYGTGACQMSRQRTAGACRYAKKHERSDGQYVKRKQCIGNVGNNGANIKTVASLLGHAGLKRTEKYPRAVDSLKREAIDSLPDISF